MPLPNVFKKIADKFSGGFLSGAAEVIEKFVADPTKKMEAMKELETLKIKHEEFLIQTEKDLEVEYLKDTQDARKSNVSIQESDKASWLAKNVGYIIDLFLAGLWGTVTIILFLKIFKIAATDVDMISLMALHGTVTAVFMITVNFHRGTSRGSEIKSQELKELRNK